MKKPKYDVIGYWSEVKLDIIRRYATEYSKIINPQKHIRRHIYVDAFAGAGQHISKRTGEFVPEPMPMRNERGAVVYYLFFASPNKTGAHIVEYIFEKYRKRGIR